MQSTPIAHSGQVFTPVAVPAVAILSFDQLAIAYPELAQIEADILHRMTIPLTMPNYSKCFDAWITPRVEALGLLREHAEIVEDHLRVVWSGRAAVLAMGGDT